MSKENTKSVESELQRLKLEAQFLQWDRELMAKKLEAAMKESYEKSPQRDGGDSVRTKEPVRADSEIEFRLPFESSGYFSQGEPSSLVSARSPELDPKVEKRVKFGESTPIKRGSAEISHTEDLKEYSAIEELQSFLSSTSCTGEISDRVGTETVSPKRVHSELLSFATSGVDTHADSSTESKTSSAGPWPLKREPRVIVEKEKEGKDSVPSNRRPNITPDRYSGKVLWKEYFRHFESCRIVNQWNEEQAVSYLSASLQGNALRLLGDVPTGQTQTYSGLVKLLERRFGSGRQSENYLVELRHRRQGPKETLQELGQAIQELTVKAYPDIQEESRDRLAKNHFLDAVESRSVREGINRARPKNLDEAIRAALETENFEKVEQQRNLDGKPVKLARVLDTGMEQRFHDIEKEMKSVLGLLTELTKQVQDKSASVERTTGNRQMPSQSKQSVKRCFNCDEQGHFARECKKPKRVNPKREGWKCFNCGKQGHVAKECGEPKRENRKQGNESQPLEGPAGRLEM